MFLNKIDSSKPVAAPVLVRGVSRAFRVFATPVAPSLSRNVHVATPSCHTDDENAAFALRCQQGGFFSKTRGLRMTAALVVFLCAVAVRASAAAGAVDDALSSGCSASLSWSLAAQSRAQWPLPPHLEQFPRPPGAVAALR